MCEEFHSSNPIYQQLADRINRQIVRNEIKPGDKLPSVREMAVQSGVNPNTVQRTYSELERMEIVETRRGQGTYVTKELDVLERLRQSLKEDQIKVFVDRMKEMGFSDQEIIQGLTEYLQEQKGGSYV